MIGKGELMGIASLKALPPKFAELDYLQDVALLALCREFGDKLIFKGGTCLYKAYKLNRFSTDLDFSAVKGLRPRGFFSRLPYFFGLLNINCRMRIEEFQNEINARIFAHGPLYSGRRETESALMLNISLRERVLLQPHRLLYASLYPEVPAFELFLMDGREILAEKIRAICTREKARDVYDLWFLLKRGIALDEKLAGKKLSHCGLSFERGAFLAKIGEKKAGWAKDLQALVAGTLPPFEQARNEIGKLL